MPNSYAANGLFSINLDECINHKLYILVILA